MKPYRAIGLALLATVVTVSTLAQTTPPASDAKPVNAKPEMTLKADTRLVVVDVVVTDSHGMPVRDLTRDEFTVLEDGKPQQLKVFETHQANTADAGSSPSTPEKADASAKSSRIADANASGPLNIVLLDALNTQTQDQIRVRQQMLELLRTLPAGPRVAVFTLTNRLKQVQGFTPDRDRLLASVDKVLATRTTLSTESKKEDQEWLAMMIRSGLPPQMIANMRQFMAERAVGNTDVRVQITLQALRQIAQSVKGYPGRKNLLWVSTTFPFTILPDNNLKNPGATIRSYGNAIKDTAVMLSAAQVAVYTIDPVGVTSLQPDATYSNTVLEYGYSVGELSDEMRQEADSSHASMEELAQVTGGHAFYNHNDIKLALERSIALGSSYYTFAYTPTNHEWDGKLRHIAVKVARRDTHLAYRHEYYATREGTTLSDAEKERDLMVALNPESPELTGLHIKASLTTPDTAGKTKVRFTIAPGQFLVSDSAQTALDLMLVVVGWNEKGEEAGHSVLNTRVPNGKQIAEQLQHRPLVIDQEVQVKPGVTYFRVGVLDRATGRMGTQQANLPASYIAAHKTEQTTRSR